MTCIAIDAGRILRKLRELGEQGVETFGSGGHGFRVEPCLAETEVSRLEQCLGAKLPEDFRSFLLEVGASGAGPAYGLLPPECWGMALKRELEGLARGPCLATPELFAAEGWFGAQAELERPLHGVITIAQQGCGYYALLVVAGAARGRVLYISEDHKGFFPEDADFLSWYERWLDELLAGFTHEWFGFAMPGTEASFAVIARTVDHPRRFAALEAMGQLPGISQQTKHVILAALDAEDPYVRAEAFRLAVQFQFASEIGERSWLALEDADFDVRDCALEALAVSGLPWRERALRALEDASADVRCTARRLLSQS